jgi:hypothetical protein
MTRKNGKILIIITVFHNKPQGCGASVAYAAGPFTNNNNNRLTVIHTYLYTYIYIYIHTLCTPFSRSDLLAVALRTKIGCHETS